MERKVHSQDSPVCSPWSLGQRVKMLVWEYAWAALCSWTPKPANTWRVFILKVFGAKVSGKPFVHQRARIQIPWNLTLHDHACLGDRAVAYSLGPIEVMEFATVAQEAYICTGTHAFDRPALNLITSPVTIGRYAFVGARAFVMPGVTVGEYAIVGANSTVTRDVEPWAVVGGNPAKFIKKRGMNMFVNEN